MQIDLSFGDPDYLYEIYDAKGKLKKLVSGGGSHKWHGLEWLYVCTGLSGLGHLWV